MDTILENENAKAPQEEERLPVVALGAVFTFPKLAIMSASRSSRRAESEKTAMTRANG
jgi:hypothetical protein